MTFRDRLTIPLANIWRIKLRSALTISGVMIAIGAFVTLLSFGAGNQQYVTDQFNQLGLFSTLYVYSDVHEQVSDTIEAVPLTDSTIEWLSGLPGVELAYPYDDYDIQATIGDSAFSTEAQVLSIFAAQTKMYSRLEAGRMFASDSASEAVLNYHMLEDLGWSADSALGQTIVVSVERIQLDSGLVAVMKSAGDAVDRVFPSGWIDSLDRPGYIRDVVRAEFGLALGTFADGFFNSPALVSDTLTVVGVLRRADRHTRSEPVLVPLATGRRFAEGGLSSDPTELLATMRSGGSLLPEKGSVFKEYPRVTLQLDPYSQVTPIMDSIESRGYRGFSFAQEFEEITKFLIYFDMGLALIGLIALITASLGIVNTMIMAIMERRREIGVLKSLGASDSDIRMLFLFETGLIGVIGSVGGILLGWVVSRLCSAIAQGVMVQQGLEPIELFTRPWWLVGIALAFGLLVSVAAGAYPAARASRVDPMQALRVE